MFTKTNFDLTEIKEFHPALVYGFDAESSRVHTDPNTVGYLQHLAGQLQDMFDAYLYAQNEILPTIKKIGIAKITVAQMKNWLNQIHLRIASTLASDIGVPSGEYTRSQVLRWHQGYEIQHYIFQYLSNELPKSIDILAVAEQSGYDKNTFKAFLALLVKIRDDKSVSLFDDQKSEISPFSPCRAGVIAINKLVTQYYANRLSKEERTIVAKIVKICFRPIQITEKMQEFIEKLLKEWKACDPNDIDQIVKLGHSAFYGLTETHPYFNANGRTATCLLNIIFRSFEKPSILLRFPSERNNPTSSYSRAIQEIDSKPELLVKHIKSRLTESKNYEDKSLSKIATLRVRSSDFATRIKKEFPEHDFDKEFDRIVKAFYEETTLYCKIMTRVDIMPEFKFFLYEEYNKLLSKHRITELLNNPVDDPENSIILFGLHFYLQQMQQVQEKFTQQRQTKLASLSPVIQKQYSEQDKTAIVDKLTQLTEQKGWKTYKANGLTILLELDDHQLATKLVSSLQTTQAMQVKLNRNKENQKHVVRIEAVNTKKLLEVVSLKNVVAEYKSSIGKVKVNS